MYTDERKSVTVQKKTYHVHKKACQDTPLLTLVGICSEGAAVGICEVVGLYEGGIVSVGFSVGETVL